MLHALPEEELTNLADAAQNTAASVRAYVAQKLREEPYLRSLFRSVPYMAKGCRIADLVALGVPHLSHLVQYGGAFHAYLFSKVTSAWVWEQGFQRRLWSNPDAAARLRHFLRKARRAVHACSLILMQVNACRVRRIHRSMQSLR